MDLAQALQALTLAVNKQTAGPSSRAAKRRRARARKAQVQVALAAPRRPRKRKRKGANNTDVSEGLIRLKRRERVIEVKSDASGNMTSSVDIVPGSFSFLSGIGKSFERSVWHSLSVYWKPMVGGLVGGLVTVGVDWDWSGSAPDRSKISAFTPNSTWAVREDCESCALTLPPSRLQSRKAYLHGSEGDYIDRGPGKIWIAGHCEKANISVGEIWVYYDITMSGTRPS